MLFHRTQFMNSLWTHLILPVALVVSGSGLLIPHAHAQRINIFQINGSPARGTFQSSTPKSLTVTSSDGPITVEVSDIRNVSIEDEPAEFGRARRNFDNERFDDGVAELAKIEKTPTDRFTLEELAFLKAYGSAMSAKRGGTISAKDAGSIAFEFTTTYPNSYHYYTIVELLGGLFVDVGRDDLAKIEFGKLVASDLGDLSFKGSFLLGQTHLRLGETAEAEGIFQRILASSDESPEALRLKVLATPMYAKSLALSNKIQPARELVEKVIQTENPENTELFAACYNVLGMCHLAEGDLKSAALDFLHTDLMFNSAADAHAEALYHLATIWPKLQKNEMAYEARENLNRLYRNSSWAKKLN